MAMDRHAQYRIETLLAVVKDNDSKVDFSELTPNRQKLLGQVDSLLQKYARDENYNNPIGLACRAMVVTILDMPEEECNPTEAHEYNFRTRVFNPTSLFISQHLAPINEKYKKLCKFVNMLRARGPIALFNNHYRNCGGLYQFSHAWGKIRDDTATAAEQYLATVTERVKRAIKTHTDLTELSQELDLYLSFEQCVTERDKIPYRMGVKPEDHDTNALVLMNCFHHAQAKKLLPEVQAFLSAANIALTQFNEDKHRNSLHIYFTWWLQIILENNSKEALKVFLEEYATLTAQPISDTEVIRSRNLYDLALFTRPHLGSANFQLFEFVRKNAASDTELKGGLGLDVHAREEKAYLLVQILKLSTIESLKEGLIKYDLILLLDGMDKQHEKPLIRSLLEHNKFFHKYSDRISNYYLRDLSTANLRQLADAMATLEFMEANETDDPLLTTIKNDFFAEMAAELQTSSMNGGTPTLKPETLEAIRHMDTILTRRCSKNAAPRVKEGEEDPVVTACRALDKLAVADFDHRGRPRARYWGSIAAWIGLSIVILAAATLLLAAAPQIITTFSQVEMASKTIDIMITAGAWGLLSGSIIGASGLTSKYGYGRSQLSANLLQWMQNPNPKQRTHNACFEVQSRLGMANRH